MLFKTIRSTLTTFNSLAIAGLCAAVLTFSILTHEDLYSEAVTSDLDALSNNLSQDLVPYLSGDEADLIDIRTLLLRLEEYENVKFAVVFDKNYQQIDVHAGNTLQVDGKIDMTVDREQLMDIPFGMSSKNGELYAYKRVGQANIAEVGYLLIVNDLEKPLVRSKLSLLLKVLPLTFIVIAIGIALSLWLNSRLLFPLQKLAKLAHKIKETNDYSIDIKVHGKQEVLDLSSEFSGMMDTIHNEEIKNKRYTKQLMQQRKDMERLANFDSLTGLPNRQYFMETLRKSLSIAQREDDDLVLMYFDLDGFKGVNDTYGHEVGDKLLIEASKRTQRFLRHGDLIARLGGDEFLILLYNNPNDFVVSDIAQRIIKEISKPFDILEWEILISASIGLTRAKDASYNLSDFVSNADVAMYKSKLEGKNTHTIFVHEMMEDNKRKLMLANNLMPGLKNGEFELYYQPKVDQQEEIVGFEALLRWNSSEFGFVSPVEFIGIAEQSGKISEITYWVMDQVMQDTPTLIEAFGDETVVSLNLSAHDLRNSNLFEDIQNLFAKYQLRPQNIEFEVTESTYLENFDMANEFFRDIREIGSSIALDDFGTGYSSLSYLTQIELHTLKIDKQFVDNLGVSKRSTLVTTTIVEMAKQLNLNICAEGVETREQRDFLVESGCQQLQGYLFGKPAPLEAILKTFGTK
ncbi:EAL domain-containing protein [Glaciecola sp. MH2013]|uniref:putative bifunctional diguanylate cyclase/phosphodiesterase n=1 Tax=Glaciecola sp. MH2013 TaxID=2785524 RepID=UPI00189D4B49|nr:EAL domain-containing protein [Glaciecola sp. MH2013]MBF7074861.1 EAL domain-containing protein [Glaciecola sp. MH2013]